MFLILFQINLFPQNSTYEDDLVSQSYYHNQIYRKPPDSFTYIKHQCINNFIRNQGSCGNCWAVAAVTALGLRRCLQGDPELLSIEEHTGCDHERSQGVTNNGCKGGNAIPAMIYSQNLGDVYESCYRYQQQQAYYPWEDVKCQSVCDNSFPKQRLKSKYAHRIYGIDNIKEEIYIHGPVAASIYLYSDFPPKDKNQPYFTQNGVKQGGHAVVIVGWGTYNGIPYWDVVNGYGKTWNKDGRVRVRMGTNEMSIESYTTAAEIQLDNKPPIQNGKFNYNDNFVVNQYAEINYQQIASCQLKVDNITVATVQGTGSFSIYVTYRPGQHDIDCGIIHQSFTVVQYSPQFYQNEFFGKPGDTIVIKVKEQETVIQKIFYNGQNYSLQQGQVNLKVQNQQPQIYLYSANTNPIMKQIARININNTIDPIPIPPPSDGTVAIITKQPNQYYQIDEPIKITMKLQFIFKIKLEVISKQNHIVQTINWQNPQNIKYELTQTFQAQKLSQNDYYFQITTEKNYKIKSNLFKVGTILCQIQFPQNMNQIYHNYDFNINTTNCQNNYLDIDGQKVLILTDTQLFKNKLSIGQHKILIQSQEILFTIIKQPVFEQSHYSSQINNAILIKAKNIPQSYQIFSELEYEVTEQGFEVKSSKLGNFHFNLTTQNIFPDIQISAILNFIDGCEISLNEKYLLVGNLTQVQQNNCFGKVVVISPDKNFSLVSSTFTPKIQGIYIVCIGNSCSKEYYISGIKITNVFDKIVSLTENVQINFITYQKQEMLLQLYCENIIYPFNLVLINEDQSKIYIILPEIICDKAKFRIRNVQKPFIYGDSEIFQVQNRILIEDLPSPFTGDIQLVQ